MKSSINLEDYNFIQENKDKDLKSKEKSKCKFNEYDDMSILLNKKYTKNTGKTNNSNFRNNYKNYQYDYEEDFYEPR